MRLFADDFIVFAQEEEGARKALKVAEIQLQKLGLQWHSEKTQVIRSSPKHSLLGKRLPESKPRFQP